MSPKFWQTPCGEVINSAILLPGGEWVVEASGRHLCLRKLDLNLDQGIASASQKVKVDLFEHPGGWDAGTIECLLAFSEGSYDPLLVVHFHNNGSDNIRVYCIDTQLPSLIQLTTVIPFDEPTVHSIALSRDILSYMAHDLLFAYTIGSSSTDSHKRAVLRFSDRPRMLGIVRFISEQRFVLADQMGVCVVDVPHWDSISEASLHTAPSSRSNIQTVNKPTWVYRFDNETPIIMNPTLPMDRHHSLGMYLHNHGSARSHTFLIRTWDDPARCASPNVHVIDISETSDDHIHSKIILPINCQFVPFGMGLRRSASRGGRLLRSPSFHPPEHDPDGGDLRLVFTSFYVEHRDHGNNDRRWSLESFKTGSVVVPGMGGASQCAFDEISGRVIMTMAGRWYFLVVDV
ncbi:hypothetical protein JAAARDRAFT_28996 [Jaapia argillacea MUCL 33604]|uniref:Uncharacterized protein n=1 Tax=Jaapia argillacea MUCL 33604 TaxID=933084 RepID=A0A067QK68_9AGAM|nr:hypothetical protein JAAARDRAFT_28996 [Jaapia argillacea MUCL 33604]